MVRQATTNEIRKAYKEFGHEVVVKRSGEIFYRESGKRYWLHGRYVTEYIYDESYGVILK